MRTRSLALAVLVVGATASACGKATTDGALPKDTPPASQAAAASQTATPTSGPIQMPSDEVVRIEVSGGRVAGGPRRVEAPVGDEVTSVVSGDVADTVHLHGYDVEVPIAPGQPATLTVTANIPGVFEIELEESKVKIGELAVGR